jgi:hypothetical protein
MCRFFWKGKKMKGKNPEDIVLSFVEKINHHDAEGMFDLMSEDHLFVDSGGFQVIGRQKMKEAWMGYFQMFPDYFITVEWKIGQENTVGLFGTAQGTYSVNGKLIAENFWKIPAAWLALVEDNRMKEWRVFADLEPVRNIMEPSERR